MPYPTDEQLAEMIAEYEADMLAEFVNELAEASA